MSDERESSGVTSRAGGVLWCCAVALLVLAALGWTKLGRWDEPGLKVFGGYRDRWFLLNVSASYAGLLLALLAALRPGRAAIRKALVVHVSAALLFVALEALAAFGLVDFRRVILGVVADADVGLQVRRRSQPGVREQGMTRFDLCERMGVDGELFPYEYTTDEFGLPNPPGKRDPEVLLLGDSMLVAPHVSQGEALSEQLQRLIGREVMNVAEVGYSVQESQRRLLSTSFSPQGRLIVQVVFEGNDLLDSFYWREWVQLAKRGSEWPESGLLKSLLVRLKHPNPALAERRWGWTTAAGAARQKVYFLYDARQVRRFEAELNEVTNALREQRDATLEVGGRYAVVLIPYKLRVFHPRTEWPPRSDLLDEELWESPLPGLLRAFCAREGIPYLDTTDALRAALDDGELPFYPLDTHLSAAGHARIAEALAPFLTEVIAD